VGSADLVYRLLAFSLHSMQAQFPPKLQVLRCGSLRWEDLAIVLGFNTAYVAGLLLVEAKLRANRLSILICAPGAKTDFYTVN
jgi:hypothetical protein